jgi:predicted PhzF superfamily epimerase YddE/YHI9
MQIYQVDAFADQLFEGNPAGVCVLPSMVQDSWMQSVAMEMNLAETAFLYREGDGYMLRWFTPETEVDLCGHATLAAAHVLWETGKLPAASDAVFYTKSGRLSAGKFGNTIRLDFPAEVDWPVTPPRELITALQWAEMLYLGRNRMDYIVELADEAAIRALQPDLEAMKLLDCRGVIVTSRASGVEYDFVSRFFAPGAGIAEDPVTGSAHCCLGPYWMKKLGKSTFNAYQASRRGGKLAVEVRGDRVLIGGKAVTVFKADFQNTI